MANLRPLNVALKQKAQNDLNENENRLLEEIESLKNWISQQSHINACTDDQYLLSFLRCSKHRLEKAKSKIEYFYIMKSKIPEVFKNREMDEKYQNFAKAGIFVRLPRPTDCDWPMIGILRLNDFDFDKFTLLDILRYRFMALEYILHKDDNSTVAGITDIIDLSKIRYSLYAQTDFLLLKKFNDVADKAIPIRFNQIHVLNCRKEFVGLFNLIKSLIPENYRNKLHIHKELEDLYKYVPRERLPMEYGGSNGTIMDAASMNYREMLSLNDFFKADEIFGANEDFKWKDNQKSTKELFGPEGTFKKLDID